MSKTLLLGRPVFALAAMRAHFAAAMLAAAVMGSPHAAIAADGDTEQFFTVHVYYDNLAPATRQQVAAAFRNAMAAAKVEVSRDDFAAAVDQAMRQLADPKGEFPLRGCANQLCWEFISREDVTSDIGTGQSR